MKRLIYVLLISLPAAVAVAATPTDQAFENLADEYISDLTNFSPVFATMVGDHSADGELDNVDSDARNENLSLYREYKAALAALDRNELSRANQIDYELLFHEIESSIWSIETLQEWAWNPLYYVDRSGSAIYALMARDFAPIEQRLLAAASRLEQLPRFLEQARGSIKSDRVPKIHAETAIKQNPGLSSIIEAMIVPQMEALTTEQRARLNAAIETARDALADHQTWLEEELLPRANGDFRIGAELYDIKLAFALNSPLSRKQITARAEQEYEAVRNRMYEVAKEVYAKKHPFTAFPDNPDESYKQAIIRAALEEAYRQLPPRDGIVEIAKQYLQQASDFVVEHNLVTMPEEPVEIIIMPEFQRGVAIAYLDPPGPLDRDQPAFYAVAPLPEDWTDEQAESFLREYNLLSLQDLTIHEGVPGHYLQIALSNRYPSPLRSVLWSGPFVEGWAVYAEEMMIENGYMDGDPLMKLINLKWYLRAITNAIIDSAIHVDGMTREAAMKLMVEGGFQEEREAAGKWVRAQLTSAQLSTYFVGYLEHIEMREAVREKWGDDFTLRRYHDQVLSYGSPPARFVRALMLG
ncbi:MAG: DUF885 domain-containing protein, partial [Gammaproteobacteria bacterium]|nr:DUF885 domain-containing protein [Gammaproteobacteria bacterium]